jgi:hypothetical protein
MSVYRVDRRSWWQPIGKPGIDASAIRSIRAAVLQLLAVVVISVAVARPALAQPAFDAELKLHTSLPTTPAPKTYWYGYELLIVDGAAVALLIGSALTFHRCVSNSSSCHNAPFEFMAISGVVVYGLGAPIIHGGRGHGGKAGLSFALRATPVVVAAALGVANVDAWPAVAVTGALLAMIIDWTVIALEDIPPPKPKRWWFNLVPSLDARRRGGMLVLADRF